MGEFKIMQFFFNIFEQNAKVSEQIQDLVKKFAGVQGQKKSRAKLTLYIVFAITHFDFGEKSCSPFEWLTVGDRAPPVYPDVT